MEELGKAVENGFAQAMWCGDRACEDEIKDKFNASSRNMPFDQEKFRFGNKIKARSVFPAFILQTSMASKYRRPWFKSMDDM